MNKEITGKIDPLVDFYRDAEAEAIGVKREQLDRVTLMSVAVKRLREQKLQSAIRREVGLT